MSTTSFPTLLQTFFTDRLLRQLRASAHTIAAYRDTFRLLLRYALERLRQSPPKLRIENLDAGFIGSFLDHLESARGNSARTRNMRLAAIRSFFRYVAICEPAYALHCERILSMPDKRHERGPGRRSVQDDMDRPPRSGAPPGRGPDGPPCLRADRIAATGCGDWTRRSPSLPRKGSQGAMYSSSARCRRESHRLAARAPRRRSGSRIRNRPREAPQPRRRRAHRHEARKDRGHALAVARQQAGDAPRPSPHGRHGPPAARCRPRRDRVVAWPRVGRDHADLSARGPENEGGRAVPDRAP